MEKKNKEQVFKYGRKFFGILLLLTGLGCSVYLLFFLKEGSDTRQAQAQLYAAFHQLAHTAPADITDSNPGSETAAVPDSSSETTDYAAALQLLNDKNPDTVGWLDIAGTAIGYPIVQTTNNSFYLTHSFSGAKDRHGAIFLDNTFSQNDTFSNRIIYGHHMKDGTMFTPLEDYKKASFCEAHKTLTYITEAGDMEEYEIFSVFVWDNEATAFDFTLLPQPDNVSSITSYLENATKRNIHKDMLAHVPVNAPVHLLTLVTCDYRTADSRLVIMAYQTR